MSENILSIKNLTKEYPGVLAIDNISLDFIKGEVHALVGENGAGKSTLIKCLSGAVIPDAGTMIVGDRCYTCITPKCSKEIGIEVVYQELNLVDSLSVAENICLGEKYGRFVNHKLMSQKAKEIFDKMNVRLDPGKTVYELSTAQQQLVEIAKAVSRNAKIIILDEPTASLTTHEVEILFEIIETLKSHQVTVVYISHRMEEVFRISDRVSVLRDGQYVATKKTSDTNRQELITLMVGRELKEIYPKCNNILEEDMLEVRNLSGAADSNISLHVKKGEIVGFAGLVGAGRTELARLIYGADPKSCGEIYIEGEKAEIHSPKKAIEKGIGLIPEDRKLQGVFLTFGVDWNIAISHLPKISKMGIINEKMVKKQAQEYIDVLGIKTPFIDQLVENLSGGNQQKVALAKTLATNSKIIIFDEPTRGIDVGAKQEIYHLMTKLAVEGKAILMISSDMEELQGMSDRIYVVAEGEIKGELMRDEFSQIAIMELITNN